ncbi:MAG: DUF4124 domain-containing protein [Succinivibrionaceae bacterium]|nr:DUF4124 domain-containing protein [Succinivibrionaceae bacterium]
MKFKKYIVAAAIVVAAAVVTVEAAKVYSWVDEKGVTHYSQQPPRENNNTQFSMIDTVFSPSELKTIQEIKEQKKRIAEQKAKQKDQEVIRGCQDLHNEKIRYYRRKIEDTYIANLNKCDLSVQNLRPSQARAKKEKCYADALKAKMIDVNQLPTEDDCVQK